MQRGLFLRGLRHGVPIALGYLSVAFAFGITATRAGLNPLQALLISMTNVTSAGQLAGVELMAAGAGLTEMALTQLTINLRYALMSISLSQRLDGSMGTLQRMIFAFCNTDEIFAVASAQPERLNKAYCYGLMLGPWAGWSLGTVLGAAAGSLLPAFFRISLGIAIYGMFLAIILPPSRKSRAVRVVVLLSAALAVAFRYVPGLNQVPAGYVIICCAVAAACVGAWRFPVAEEPEGEEAPQA
ncbi:MAG: AzlC family ABC transporter permease [Clostridia bacterium]|nr:AzlC family ABC transporter permease [Clostridia bacterium]